MQLSCWNSQIVVQKHVLLKEANYNHVTKMTPPPPPHWSSVTVRYKLLMFCIVLWYNLPGQVRDYCTFCTSANCYMYAFTFSVWCLDWKLLKKIIHKRFKLKSILFSNSLVIQKRFTVWVPSVQYFQEMYIFISPKQKGRFSNHLDRARKICLWNGRIFLS